MNVPSIIDGFSKNERLLLWDLFDADFALWEIAYDFSYDLESAREAVLRMIERGLAELRAQNAETLLCSDPLLGEELYEALYEDRAWLPWKDAPRERVYRLFATELGRTVGDEAGDPRRDISSL